MGIISWCRNAWATARAAIATNSANDSVPASGQAELRPPRVREVRLPTFAERLTHLFDQYRLGHINLGEYASRVQEEQDDCLEAVLFFRQSISELATAQYEAELEELEENLEECLWRLEWIAVQQRKAGID